MDPWTERDFIDARERHLDIELHLLLCPGLIDDSIFLLVFECISLEEGEIVCGNVCFPNLGKPEICHRSTANPVLLF